MQHVRKSALDSAVDSPYSSVVVQKKCDAAGQYLRSDGSVYQGTMYLGRPHGRGKLSLKGGGSYAGQFLFGQKHGFGTLRYPCGFVYVDSFHQNLKHGYGIFWFETSTPER
jgi:hypothetical protein